MSDDTETKTEKQTVNMSLPRSPEMKKYLPYIRKIAEAWFPDSNTYGKKSHKKWSKPK